MLSWNEKEVTEIISLNWKHYWQISYVLHQCTARSNIELSSEETWSIKTNTSTHKNKKCWGYVGDGVNKLVFLHLSIKTKCLIDETVPFTKSPLQASPGLSALNYHLITTQIALKIPHCTLNKSALAYSRAYQLLIAIR